MPISSGELLVIIIVMIVIIGPSRLPMVTTTITKWVKNARRQLTALRASLDAEAGEDLRNLDLRAFDVRQYDPRRIIREAVQEEMQEWKDLINPKAPINTKDRQTPAAARPTTPTSSIASINPPNKTETPTQNPTSTSPSAPGNTPDARKKTAGWPGLKAVGQDMDSPAEHPSRLTRSRYAPSARESAIADWYARQRGRRRLGSRQPQTRAYFKARQQRGKRN